jgi:peptidylprolyl isomerase/FKBP-type peptidyl-prolyl cis-trans isomerase FklB
MTRIAAVLALAALIAGCQAKAQPDPDQAQSAAEAQAFMAKNAKAPGVQTLPSGVEYKVVRAGPPGGAHPTLQDNVKVNYELKLLSGQVIDSSYQQGEPATMALGDLIPAWKEAIPLMRPGDEWMLYVPPSMGYGEEGKGPVPPNAVLVFRIELLGVEPASAQ